MSFWSLGNIDLFGFIGGETNFYVLMRGLLVMRFTPVSL